MKEPRSVQERELICCARKRAQPVAPMSVGACIIEDDLLETSTFEELTDEIAARASTSGHPITDGPNFPASTFAE
jgi:hypothetical protein